MAGSLGETATDAKITQKLSHRVATEPNVVLRWLPIDHFQFDIQLMLADEPVNRLFFTANLIYEFMLQGGAAELHAAFFQAGDLACCNFSSVCH